MSSSQVPNFYILSSSLPFLIPVPINFIFLHHSIPFPLSMFQQPFQISSIPVSNGLDDFIELSNNNDIQTVHRVLSITWPEPYPLSGQISSSAVLKSIRIDKVKKPILHLAWSWRKTPHWIVGGRTKAELPS